MRRDFLGEKYYIISYFESVTSMSFIATL